MVALLLVEVDPYQAHRRRRRTTDCYSSLEALEREGGCIHNEGRTVVGIHLGHTHHFEDHTHHAHLRIVTRSSGRSLPSHSPRSYGHRCTWIADHCYHSHRNERTCRRIGPGDAHRGGSLEPDAVGLRAAAMSLERTWGYLYERRGRLSCETWHWCLVEVGLVYACWRSCLMQSRSWEVEVRHLACSGHQGGPSGLRCDRKIQWNSYLGRSIRFLDEARAVCCRGDIDTAIAH